MALFGKKKKENKPERTPPALSQNETSYFGKDLTIKGSVSGNGNVIILGNLDGKFNLRGRVKIAQPAKIKGEVRADVISVNGVVQGSLIAKERLHLDQTARIEGQVATPRLSISEGASFDGEVKMSDSSSRPSGAPAEGSTPIAQNKTAPAKE
jgi:cytoskeletal protein CcmA (bactofilin family)